MPDRDADAPDRLVDRLLGHLATARRWSSRPAVGRVLVALAVAALVVGAVGAVRSLPDDAAVEWPLVALVALVGTPATVALSSFGYRLTAAAAGVEESLGDAARISIYGTAANLLPVPGGSIVRIEALRRGGVSVRTATGVTIAVGFVWLGVSLLMAGAIGLLATPGLAVLFLVGGAVPMVAAWRILDRAGAPWSVALALVAVHAGVAVVQAGRFWVTITAIGASPSISQAFALGVSVSVAAAAGFLPGGLGIREAVATVLGPLIGLTAAETFLATLLDRIAGLASIAVVAVVVLAATRGNARRILAEPGGSLAPPDRRSGTTT